MNQTSRTDDVEDHPGWNQNPPQLSAEETTRQDLNGIVNLREQRDHTLQNTNAQETPTRVDDENIDPTPPSRNEDAANANNSTKALTLKFSIPRFLRPLIKFASFVGPGFLVAVAYIDPGNYATDVAAGAESRYALLFVVLMSNLFAVFLQTLCIKLGSVTGLSLAENCREHLPKWLNMVLYILAESAIVATDIAEVFPLVVVYFDDYINCFIGDWFRHCAELAVEDSFSSRMRYLAGRRALSFDLLPTQWINVGPSCFRVLRYPPRYFRGDLLLHPAFPDQRAVRGHGTQRLPSFASCRSRLRVSSITLLDVLQLKLMHISQYLPKLRHSRSDGHASLLVSGQWCCPATFERI